MSPLEQLLALLALAREVDLEVRRVAAADATTSGVCRLRDRVFVLLATGDPSERQLAVLARALRDHRADACEARYLPPAVRSALESKEADECRPTRSEAQPSEGPSDKEADRPTRGEAKPSEGP